MDMPSHSALEAHNDFYGFPSHPISIFHTGPAWPLPTGPQAQRIPKEARPVCNHEIVPVWPQVGEQIYQHFDSINLKWTSIDPVRVAKVREEKPSPLFLWVVVIPGTLSHGDAQVAAVRCKEILANYGINDVEIAFRESIFTRSTGPQLLDHIPFFHPTADIRPFFYPTAGIRNPFTPTLGLQIARKAFPYFEGTGCIYLCEGGDSDRILLLTARHVALPPSKHPNSLYHRKKNNIPRLDVIHLGSKAYQTALKVIMNKIDNVSITIDYYTDKIQNMGEASENEEAAITDAREESKVKLVKEEKLKATVNEFYGDITRFWTLETERVVGHVLYAPPMPVGSGDTRFTEDWALVELDRTKSNWNTSRGNVIHIGTKFSVGEFMVKMYPDHETRPKLIYPSGGLMQLRDFVKDGELHRSTMLDANGEECFIVVKNGAGTGLTFGRASGIESFVRDYNEHGSINSTSMEIAIYAYSHKDFVFSAPGDSGSVIGDANNRIVGMITGGSGKNDYMDVTYPSPYYFLEERIKMAFPNSYLYPIVEAII